MMIIRNTKSSPLLHTIVSISFLKKIVGLKGFMPRASLNFSPLTRLFSVVLMTQSAKKVFLKLQLVQELDGNGLAKVVF